MTTVEHAHDHTREQPKEKMESFMVLILRRFATSMSVQHARLNGGTISRLFSAGGTWIQR